MKHSLFSLVVLACLCVAGTAPVFGMPSKGKLVTEVIEGGTFRGKAAKADFPRRIAVQSGDHAYTLVALGSGLRKKKAIFKVYEGIAYAEESASLNADPYDALLGGSFATRVVMYFLRDVGGNKIQNAWEDGFEKFLGDDIDALFEIDRNSFVGYFTTDMKKGETIVITWLPDHGLYAEVAGQSFPAIKNPQIAAAVLGNWFGEKPISKGMKRDMVRFLSE